MTIRELIQKSTEHLLRIITQPRSELTRWQRAARFTYDLGRTGAQQLRRDRASQMAAALAYRTLFSLLPILAVGTALGGVMTLVGLMLCAGALGLLGWFLLF